MGTRSTLPVNTFHVAVDHVDRDTHTASSTYLGTVDQAHVNEVRAIAALETTERWVKDHPRQPGAFMVLRDDGDLDVYVPTNAPAVQKPPTAVAARAAAAPPATAYIDGVVRFGDQSIGGAMDTPNNPPRATWHTTESPAGKSYFYSIAAYLIRVGAEPQVIYDPASDLLGQFGPLTQSGRALRNDGSRRTNREGKVNIQVEVLGRARDPWTNGFDPAKKPNYRKLIAAMRAHGIPDVWPAGKLAATASSPTKRDRTTWQTMGGHYGHCQVPGNDHWDPGAIDTTIVPGKAQTSGGSTGGGTAPSKPSTGTGTTSPARYQATINGLAYGYGAKGDHVTRVGKALVAKGFGKHYTSGPGPTWSDADTRNYADFQKSLGHSGKAADGVPGEASLKKLLGTLPSKPKPAQPANEPFPGAEFFSPGRRSPIITAMGRRLVAEGCSAYSQGPGPSWTNADKAAYAKWQRKLGYTGTAADGIPGKKSWDALKVPKQL
ncbi:peptidoglycan-binding protein [Streptomyces sp. NPDC015130]|uniref:peptidoglycan-binding protein n=1 Tax=Streptomyces sp. NPDC015130 TaxID=3364940 RepID=UPI0036F67303